jgi:hypothetical protein
MPESGGPGRPLPPTQYLADQLTLFQPRRADYPNLLLLPPPKFFHLPASLITNVISKLRPECKFPTKIEMAFSQILAMGS